MRPGAILRRFSHISATTAVLFFSSNALGYDFRFLALPSFADVFGAGRDFRGCLLDSALIVVTTVLRGLSQYVGRVAVAPLESLI